MDREQRRRQRLERLPRPSNWESMSKNQMKRGRNMEGGHVKCKVMVGPSAAWGPAEPLQWQRLERQQECGHQRCEEGGAQGTKGLSPGQLTPLLLEL